MNLAFYWYAIANAEIWRIVSVVTWALHGGKGSKIWKSHVTVTTYDHYIIRCPYILCNKTHVMGYNLIVFLQHVAEGQWYLFFFFVPIILFYCCCMNWTLHWKTNCNYDFEHIHLIFIQKFITLSWITPFSPFILFDTINNIDGNISIFSSNISLYSPKLK